MPLLWSVLPVMMYRTRLMLIYNRDTDPCEMTLCKTENWDGVCFILDALDTKLLCCHTCQPLFHKMTFSAQAHLQCMSSKRFHVQKMMGDSRLSSLLWSCCWCCCCKQGGKVSGTDRFVLAVWWCTGVGGVLIWCLVRVWSEDGDFHSY